jgi:hypothetical protein
MQFKSFVICEINLRTEYNAANSYLYVSSSTQIIFKNCLL